MSDRLWKIVTGLPKLKKVTEVWDVVEQSLAKGDVAFVAELGTALATWYGAPAAQNWQYRSIFKHLFRLLTTTPGQEHVQQTLRLVLAAASVDPRLPRKAASLLVASQPSEYLAVVFTDRSSGGDACEELRACIVHELVVRNVKLADMPDISGWAQSPHWRHHPLGRLPLALTPIEEALLHPLYFVGGDGHSRPSERRDGPSSTPSNALHLPEVTETTTEAFSAAAGAAVANWVQESNGYVEVGEFDLAEPVETGALSQVLVTTGLECLQVGGSSKQLALIPWQPKQAWRALFAAASTGGAYGDGEYGAYGRLAAWQSLAALSGTASDASIDEVQRQVETCDWHSFEAATEWFVCVAWDLGLVAVRDEGRRLAVLAATDTD